MQISAHHGGFVLCRIAHRAVAPKEAKAQRIKETWRHFNLQGDPTCKGDLDSIADKPKLSMHRKSTHHDPVLDTRKTWSPCRQAKFGHQVGRGNPDLHRKLPVKSKAKPVQGKRGFQHQNSKSGTKSAETKNACYKLRITALICECRLSALYKSTRAIHWCLQWNVRLLVAESETCRGSKDRRHRRLQSCTCALPCINRALDF